MAASPRQKPATTADLTMGSMNLTSSTEGKHSTDPVIQEDQKLLSPLGCTDSVSLDATSVPHDNSITLSSQTRSLTPSPSPPESTGSKSQVSLSTRLEFLSSLAASEQPVLPSESLQIIHSHLDIIQRTLTSLPHEPPPIPENERIPAKSSAVNEVPKFHEESRALLAHLTTSLTTLRTRREETLRLQARLIARCNNLTAKQLFQASEIDLLTSTNTELASSNAVLASTSDDLRNQIVELESRERLLERQNAFLNQKLNRSQQHTQYLNSRVSEAKRANFEDEIALAAMSAAVGGLEGWLDSFAERAYTILHNSPQISKSNVQHSNTVNKQQSPGHRGTPSPSIRGRGRFRGRYNAQSQTVGPLSPPSTPASRSGNNNNSTSNAADWALLNNATSSPRHPHFATEITDSTMPTTSFTSSVGEQQISEMEEGVRSWIKGFRDVEESIRMRIRSRKAEEAAPEEQDQIAGGARSSKSNINNNNNDDDDDDIFDDGDDFDNEEEGDEREEFGDFVQAR